MSNPLTFLLPLPYHRVRCALVVQTGEGARLADIVRRLRDIFPGARVEVLLREVDVGRRDEIAADQVRVARYEERYALLRALRRERYDVVAFQLGDGAVGGELKRLPLLLRCRSIVAFNPSLDYFPVNVFRLADVAHHFGLAGAPGSASLLRTVIGVAAEVALRPVLLAYLLASVAWIRLGGALRRRAMAKP